MLECHIFYITAVASSWIVGKSGNPDPPSPSDKPKTSTPTLEERLNAAKHEHVSEVQRLDDTLSGILNGSVNGEVNVACKDGKRTHSVEGLGKQVLDYGQVTYLLKTGKSTVADGVTTYRFDGVGTIIIEPGLTLYNSPVL